MKDDKNKINENQKDNSKNVNEKKNDNNINDNKSKSNKNEEQNIEGTYLISKDRVNNIKFLKKVKFYKGVISYKYIYDSFLNGQLLDLTEEEILNKYKLQ